MGRIEQGKGMEVIGMVERMGFEARQRIVTTGYGKAGYFTVASQQLWTASQVERDWLAELGLSIEAGAVREWQWQPEPVAVRYKHARTACTRTYRPDARVVWDGPEGEVFYEIKYGRIEQKAGNNIVAFCLTYPERKMVLVWKGRLPRKGATKRQWDKIMPHIDHVWYLK